MALAYLRCMLKNVKHFIMFDKSNMLRGTVLNNTMTYFRKPSCEISLTKMIKQVFPKMNYKYRLEMTRFSQTTPDHSAVLMALPTLPPPQKKKNFCSQNYTNPSWNYVF
jgi:hypothetical protein